MLSATLDKTARDYDVEIAEMLLLATALTSDEVLPKLVDQTAGVAGLPGIAVIATATGDEVDADS